MIITGTIYRPLVIYNELPSSKVMALEASAA